MAQERFKYAIELRYQIIVLAVKPTKSYHYSSLGSFWVNSLLQVLKVSKNAKTRNRHNQVAQLTQDTNGKKTSSQLDTTNESQEVSPFPVGDHKAQINRQRQN